MNESEREREKLRENERDNDGIKETKYYMQAFVVVVIVVVVVEIYVNQRRPIGLLAKANYAKDSLAHTYTTFVRGNIFGHKYCSCCDTFYELCSDFLDLHIEHIISDRRVLTIRFGDFYESFG